MDEETPTGRSLALVVDIGSDAEAMNAGEVLLRAMLALQSHGLEGSLHFWKDMLEC